MSNQKPAAGKEIAKKVAQSSKPCTDDFTPRTELDGKNDSGPEPEIHGREIPPQ
jgi:hypothetical protein